MLENIDGDVDVEDKVKLAIVIFDADCNSLEVDLLTVISYWNKKLQLFKEKISYISIFAVNKYDFLKFPTDI